jgi:hypothetical protein
MLKKEVACATSKEPTMHGQPPPLYFFLVRPMFLNAL